MSVVLRRAAERPKEERKNMKKLLTAAALGALCLAPLAAFAGSGEWTGYITDTHCAQKGAAKEHTADCVEKCMKGGSKAQILNEADKKIYNLDGFDKVKGLVGQKVTVKGTLDSESSTIQVESASAAK
jgi:hypothetical protein